MRPNLPASPTDAARVDSLRATMRMLVAEGDVESVAMLAKEAYAHAARLRNELRPHEQVFGVATEVLSEYLIASDRTAVNDAEFTIELEPKKETPVTNEAMLYDKLHALRIDGAPLPAALLRDCAYVDTPIPPPPQKRTNLTKIKPLVKRFGKDVQDVIDACVTYTARPRRLIFAPKEGPHGNTNTAAIEQRHDAHTRN